jgi:hypothetical protein
MRMKKRRKRIGISLAMLGAILLPLAATAKKKPPDTYAVISGSVYQESGYALPNAAASLVAESGSVDKAGKAQKMETVSDARGEFIFRVPPGPMKYDIVVAAKGYLNLRKTVNVEGQERVEVTFQLERESK